MVKEELIKRSPLRILEKSTHGGLGEGNIGIIAARKGVGKTACLVNIAADRLLQNKHIIHVSFTEQTSHIVAWYEDIFSELARRFNLDHATDVHDDCIRNRIIMNFAQDGIHVEKIEQRIRTLIDKGNFHAETLIIDGYDFTKSSLEDLRTFRALANELGLELWFSASIPDEHGFFDGSAVPPTLTSLLDEIAIIICLQPKGDFIHLNLIKDHDAKVVEDSHLKVDPKILLIAEEN